MFKINEDLSIYATRGDIVFFFVTADDNGTVHKFQPNDVVRVKVSTKKNCESVVLQKDFVVEAETDRVDIFLTGEDTKIGDVISKPVDLWYEIELNPLTNPQTIIGYDDDGAKIFKLFPEGADLTEPIEKEDIPIVDDDFDVTSERPLQNQAITRGFLNVAENIKDIKNRIRADFENIQTVAEEAKDTANRAIEIAENAEGGGSSNSGIIVGKGDPDGGTEASVGMLYMNENDGSLYKCVRIDWEDMDGTLYPMCYVWEPIIVVDSQLWSGGANPVSGEAVSDALFSRDIRLEDLEDRVSTITELSKVELVSYVGTGTCGANNPCSIELSFVPKLLKIIAIFDSTGMAKSYNYQMDAINCENLSTEYTEKTGFYLDHGSTYISSRSYAKKSLNGKTISWYCGAETNAYYQANASGETYYILVIG